MCWRAGFSATFEEVQAFSGKGPEEVLDQLRGNQSADPFQLVQLSDRDWRKIANMNQKEREMLQMTSRNMIKELNVAWLDRMRHPEGALKERMALFWHNHFACSSNNALFVQKYANTIREHSLGNFRDLLFAVSKEPAMLQYLNNQQNRKKSPNENFAREVMELFTVGRGHYSEDDIKNAARAFTGWGFDNRGEFIFRPRIHDYEEKTFLGAQGNFNGEDILEKLLEQKQTAVYVTSKIYRYLVNEQRVDEKRIEQLATEFFESGYDIGKLVEEIFLSPWFFESENIGSNIKSPVDLLLGLQTAFNVKFHSAEPLVFIQNVLGQKLFYPPNVAGWPGGLNWIDSSSLLIRARLGELLLMGQSFRIDPKVSGDDFDQLKVRNALKGLQVTIDTEGLYTIPEAEFVATMKHYLLQSNDQVKIQRSGDRLQTLVNITKLPEFQMC